MESTLTIDSGGAKIWRNSNGWLHRLDGPAIIYPGGTQLWYCNGELHRTDGPAVEWHCGSKEWWLNGIEQDPPVEESSVIETITTSLLVPLKTKRLIELD